MARKKIEPIKTLGKDTNKLTVQKSLPLFALWRSDLTLAEFKILDTYLARINSHEPNKRTVIFEKGELEEILGLTKLSAKLLDDRLKNLMTSIPIPDPVKPNKFTRVSLFEKAVCEKDDNDLWQVELTCTHSAMKYVFNVDSLGYLRYKLRCITSMTSRYTYIMFMYLESNRFRKSWQIDLEELKQILKCDTEEYANEFKYFNRDILKKIQKELHKKTECRYTYESIKKGRKVVAIKFTLETLKDFDEIAAEEKEWELAEAELERYEALPEWEQWIEDYCKCCDDIFTKVEMQEFIGMTNKLPLSQMYKNAPVDDINIHRYEYILDKYRAFKVADSKDPKNNKYAYFKRMIEKDIAEYE